MIITVILDEEYDQPKICAYLLIFLGASLKQAGSYLSAAVLAGYLATKQQAGGDGITLNLINAPAMAKEQNLQVRINVYKLTGTCK